MLDTNIFSSNCIRYIIICLIFEIYIVYHDVLSTVGMTACQKCLKKLSEVQDDTLASSLQHWGYLHKDSNGIF